MAQTDAKKRKESVSDWEAIEFKPPIDLIPDEFDRKSNENVLVELVCAGNDSAADDFGDLLSELGFSVTKWDADKEQFVMRRPDDSWFINMVETKIKDKNCDGLIMIFSKVAYSSTDMKHIWSKFTTKQCPELKNKPKIFIFQTVKLVHSDGPMVLPHGRTAYDTPAEADLLIIYDRYDKDRADLLDQLQDFIRKYGDQEDLITLASLGYGFDYQPLIISTMTRKFFVKIHDYRGHHLDYFTKHEVVKEHINTFKDHLVEKLPEKNETSSSIFQSLKKKFSFRKKRDGHKSELGESSTSTRRSRENGKLEEKEKEQNNVEDNAARIENQTSTTDEQETLKTAIPILKSRSKKTSIGSRDTEIRKSKRVSTASSNSGDRPAWKP